MLGNYLRNLPHKTDAPVDVPESGTAPKGASSACPLREIEPQADTDDATVHATDFSRQLDLGTHLASVRRMSAGLSHEIANPLAVAIGTLHFVRQEVTRLLETERLMRALVASPPDQLEGNVADARAQLASGCEPDDLLSALDDMATSSKRIETLLTKLRGLIGQGIGRPQQVDLVALVRRVRGEAAEALEGITVEEQADRPLLVHVDPNLLGEIIHNLVMNAAQAARSQAVPWVQLAIYRSGPRAVVSIRDNGPGIPEALRDKIFEPFFTASTGRGPHGLGLGLSLCRERARQIGAEISFSSIAGGGACFRVELERDEPM
jgi:two-component system sensor histidine kinase HupT/HoxJ